MKILFVAPWIPSPVRPRSLALLRMLAASHEVRFVGLVRDAAEAGLAEALPVDRRTLVPNPPLPAFARSFRALCTGAALQTGYAGPRALTAAVVRELRAFEPDVVHLNVFRTAHLVEACGSTPVLIDLDEFRSGYYDQLAATGPNSAWRALGRIEGRRMRAREEALVGMGVPIIVSAPEPGALLVRSPCDLRPRSADPDGATVLFVGRLSYEANVDGLLWFVRECWPGVRARVPGATLRIVGESPPRSVRTLRGSGIEVHPDVPDVEPHYAAASVAIAPVFRGTGVQLKLVQALSAGVATVTTPAVAERAGVRDGVHVRTAADPAGWIEATCALLTDRTEAARLAGAGHGWVVANHGPDAVRRQLDAAYAAVGGQPAPTY